jgi:hypothetical protein
MFPLGLAAFVNLRWGNDGGLGVYVSCALPLRRARIFLFSFQNPPFDGITVRASGGAAGVQRCWLPRAAASTLKPFSW